MVIDFNYITSFVNVNIYSYKFLSALSLLYLTYFDVFLFVQYILNFSLQFLLWLIGCLKVYFLCPYICGVLFSCYLYSIVIGIDTLYDFSSYQFIKICCLKYVLFWIILHIHLKKMYILVLGEYNLFVSCVCRSIAPYLFLPKPTAFHSFGNLSSDLEINHSESLYTVCQILNFICSPLYGS